MFALHSSRLRRRLSAPTSGSARRRARERRQAEQTRAEGERLARERREIKAIEKLESQHRVRQELATYAPWGRAGGGAPNPRGVRFTNIKAKGIIPEDELRGVQLSDIHGGWASSLHHRPRQRRTPLRLREDPQLFFTETLRKSIENDIRYRQTPRQQRHYKEILDDLVDQKNKALQEEILRNLENEKKMHAMKGPWGKPGPGGTTWRNPRNIGLNFSKSMGWTDNDMFSKMRGDQRRHKGSSLTLPKVKRDDDSYEDDYQDKENESSSNGKLPVITPNSGNATSNRNQESASKTVNGYKVKGKRSPKKIKFVKRLTNGEEVRVVYPDDFYDTGTQTVEYKKGNGKKENSEESMLRLTGGIELVPLMARRRRVGARTLPSSDVTRPPEQPCQWREMLNGEHLRVLKNQMKVKRQQKEERRIDSAESVRRHHATWASLWGRPGHGAPQQRGRYARSNLAQLLYVAPLYQ